MLTTVVSATTRVEDAAVTPLVGFPSVAGVGAVAVAVATGDAAAASVDDAEFWIAVASVELAVRALEGTDFGGGKSSCETAIAISERKRARKKRLSIQGTGS